MEGSTHTATRGARGRLSADLVDFAEGMRRTSAIGAVTYGAFLAVDVVLHLVMYPSSRLDLLIAYRLAGTGILVGWFFYARAALGPLPGRVAATAVVFATTTAAMALMANQLGGLSSPYVHGMAFYYLAAATLMPSPWRRMVVLLVPAHLVFVATLAAAAALDPAWSWQWQVRDQVVGFVVAVFFETALLAFACVSSHVLWASRAQLYRARRLGRYRLQAPLGRGGMNEVWLARDENLGREVAVKVLRGAPATDDDRWLRFEREAQVASSLASPHVVKIYDYGASDDGIAYIAMEYLRGLDVADLVNAYGPLDVRRAVHLMRQAAQALAEAHERGLVHRDVKPANLFVLSTAEAPDFVKVLDFGLVRELTRPAGDGTREGVTLGTPAFMAPEQFLGADVTAASDVYGLGATLYFMLTGRQPFGDKGTDDDAALWRAHSSTPLPPIAERRGEPVALALEAVLANAMAKHPSDRYRDAAALVRALDDLPEVGAWTTVEAAGFWKVVRLTPFPTRRGSSASKTVTVAGRTSDRGAAVRPASAGPGSAQVARTPTPSRARRDE